MSKINNFLQIKWHLNQLLIYRILTNKTFYKIKYIDGKTFWSDDNFDTLFKRFICHGKHVIIKKTN